MRRSPDDRAVSPVVGVTLLVGIVVLLAGVTAAVFLDIGEEREPSPDVVFESTSAEVGPGLVIGHAGGDRLRSERIELRGAARPGSLPGTFTSGDTHHVVPTSDSVEVVWDNGQTSYVLWEFDVPPGDTIPEPEEKCAYVDSVTNGGTSDVDIENVVVGCALVTSGQIDTENVTVIADVESTGADVEAEDSDYYGDLTGVGDTDVENGTVTGRVESQGQVDLDVVAVGGEVVGDLQVDVQDGTVGGPVRSRNEDVQLQNVETDGGVRAGTDADIDAATVDGAVTTDAAGGQIDVDGTTVGGQVDGGGQVDVQNGTVGGPVQSRNEDVQLQNATVGGDVTADTAATVQNGRVEGAVDAGGQVDIDVATVTGAILTDGDVDVQDGTVGGTVNTTGDVSLQNATVGDVYTEGAVDLDAATVEGDVYGAGQVDLDGVTVAGDVYAGSFQCDASTVNGQDCDDYSPEDPEDY